MTAPLFADRIQCVYAPFGSGPAVWTAVSQLLERPLLAESNGMDSPPLNGIYVPDWSC